MVVFKSTPSPCCCVNCTIQSDSDTINSILHFTCFNLPVLTFIYIYQFIVLAVIKKDYTLIWLCLYFCLISRSSCSVTFFIKSRFRCLNINMNNNVSKIRVDLPYSLIYVRYARYVLFGYYKQ